MRSQGPADREAIVVHRVPTAAELVIPAPRLAVWAAATAEGEADPGEQLIVGAPTSGVGARHLHVGPPLPPFGMRTVTYCEVTALQQGYWYTKVTLATSWEHTETLTLADTADGQTLARIDGWWTRPAPPGANFEAVRAHISELAAKRLKHIADRVEPEAAAAASQGSI